MNLKFYYKLFINHTPKFRKSFFENLPEYKILFENFEYINSSTYLVAKVVINGKIYFFKETFPYRNKKEYLIRLINSFLKKGTYFKNQEEYLKSILNNGKGIKRFFLMGMKNDAKSNLSKFLNTEDASIIGFLKTDDNDKIGALKEFVLFCWGNISAFSMFPKKRGGYNTYNANRAIAQRIVDKSMGVNLLVDTRMVKLIVGDDFKLGVLTDCAKGINTNSFTRHALKAAVSPQLQRHLNNLNIIDALCLERDHGPNNYNVVCDKNGLAKRILCFDNDSPFSFYPIFSCKFCTYSNVSPIIDKKGKFNRKYIDKEILDKIKNLDIKNLTDKLKNYLNFYQRVSFKIRFFKLKRAILNALSEKTLLVLSEQDWSEYTVDYEINKAHYNSYLRLYYGWLG